MNSAYKGNIEVAKQLTEPRFNDVKQRIADTNQVIRVAIRTSERGELFMVLYKALYKELNVMFQLKLTCSGQQKATAACKAGFLGLSLSIYNLVYAAWEIAEGKRKKAIDEAYNSYRRSVLEGNEQNIHPAYVLGSAVLTALEKIAVEDF
ncbi:unnamed protein product [Nippostrongylus brasiliensis]|uniref:BRO1 domain-containing protein n=1 Tax=Nippostrongylus brasiliensis TaxID=27835 RepID=A0A0N4YR35_NIPBR|nr:unnamed protein product [Nippostrongylus brasiliensis]